MLKLPNSCTALRFFLSPVLIFRLSVRSVEKAGKGLRPARSQELYFLISEDKMDQERETLANVAV